MNQSKLNTSLGWRTRGYLPHFDNRVRMQSITTRLFDSMPQSLLKAWRIELDRGLITDVTLRRRIEKYLDLGFGACFLRDPRVAEMVVTALKHHDDKKYELRSYCVMPNHLHFLIKPLNNSSLAAIAHSIKSYTAHEANKILGRSGQFWSPEPFDRYIRDERHYKAAKRYIEMNPVKAGLCGMPEEWRYSSAWER